MISFLIHVTSVYSSTAYIENDDIEKKGKIKRFQSFPLLLHD